MPERATYPHRILKVRTVAPAPGREEPPRDAVWLSLTPFPPGNAPVFLGSLWLWCDETLADHAPVLRIGPPAAGEAAQERQPAAVNLWASPKFGVKTLADRSPGWRRIDFTLTLSQKAVGSQKEASGKAGTDLVVHAVIAMASGPARRAPVGRIIERSQRWQFRSPPRAEPHPFTNETAGSGDGQVTGFVGGAPKSGTTWMQILLNQHPEVLSVGEGVFTNIIRLDQPNPSNQWFPPRLNGGQLRDFTAELLIRRMFELNRTTFQCRVVTDKTPGNSRLFRHLLALVPEARMVHCIRHPLDVVISRLHHEVALSSNEQAQNAAFVGDGAVLEMLAPALAASETLPLSHPEVWPVITAILDEWAVFQEEALAAVEAFPGQVLISRYEDMLADGIAAAQRVFAHLGVATDHAIMESCVRAASFDTIKKNAIGGEGGTVFFRKGTARQFETAMTEADQEMALAHLRARLPTFASLGYEVTVREVA